MKVLITFFPIDDMGGITNHNEELVAGLKELGHEVTVKLLMWRDSAPRSVAGGRDQPSNYDGLTYDQRKGYSWTSKDIIPYAGATNLAKWKEYASAFDLIVWQVAVPTKRAENRSNTDWIELYRVDVPQVAVIHDGNFLDSYPWLSLIRGRLTGIACVHTCAYNSAKHIDVKSALILNPQELGPLPDLSKEAFFQRRKGFLSLQTFKAWKRVPELVQAVPYMGNITKLLAGKGIDYYYLTSKDKCKWPGAWDSALSAGMVYYDVISNQARDHALRSVTTLIDASWSKKYAKIGGHFNRVSIDAIKQGCMPVVRDLAIGTADEELFKDNVNCLVIPWDASPGEFGHLASEYANLPYDAYVRIMGEAVRLLPLFERKAIAQQFLDLGTGKSLPSEQRGTMDPEVYTHALGALSSFFNDKG